MDNACTSSTTSPTTLPRGRTAVWLVIGILLIATNLRAPVTAVGPLLDTLRQSFGMSAGTAGLLLTLPLLCFAVFSPLAARLARDAGLERTLFGALLVIALGVALRSSGATWALLAGTCVIGCGIAAGNVLLPSLLKRDFPNDLTRLTAVYALTMGSSAALGSVVAVPLERAIGWSWALAAFMVLPVLAMLAWLPQLARHTAPAATPQKEGAIWRHALAWQVTLFMGTNAFIYYVVAAWLPAMLASQGHDLAEAGNLHGLMQLASSVPGVLLLPLMRRLPDQRLAAASMSACAVAGLAGLLLWPAWAAVWVSLFGFGSGAVLILALAFVGMRVASPRQAAALSAMAQFLGYLMAAVGPIAMGGVHDLAGNWDLVLVICCIVAAIMGVFGFLAGRAGKVIGA